MAAPEGIGQFFFFNDTATTEIYTLSLHDALPICALLHLAGQLGDGRAALGVEAQRLLHAVEQVGRDRKSTRLNSSHANISYAVFCLKKKKLGYADDSSRLILPPEGSGSRQFHRHL